MTSRYAGLSRETLARLVPELLLVGHLIDRAGMPWCIAELGREAMTRIAIEEWAGASPLYTRRMQRALGFEGDDVPTIFKGMQLDVGAPPQFMDFRYAVHDRHHGEFHLDHCGALCDVEPMGDEYVESMCHDIEDPTFDMTAAATNPRARMRPIHRPPRRPSGRTPVCAWTVEIGPSPAQLPHYPALDHNAASLLVGLELDPIDPHQEGLSDYAGPLVSDVDFAAFSHSALARVADEVVVQMHLLNRAFVFAVGQRCEATVTRGIALRQLVGHAGIAAERLHRALDLGRTTEDAARLVELHPLFNPAAYVALAREGATVSVTRSPAHADGGWLSLVGPSSLDPLRSIVRAVDPRFDVEAAGDDDAWTARVVATGTVHPEREEVAVTRFSTGAGFAFSPRRSLPLVVS